MLVADDQASFRAVMREVVAAAPGFELVGEAESGDEAINLVEELAPRMVIIDKRMPDASGLEICREITTRHPDIAVLLCSVEEVDSRLAAEYGATHAVHKQHLSPRLLADVWNAHRV